jgi:hypothetical protein
VLVTPAPLPAGPIPLAARGLAAVLARAGPAGAVIVANPGSRTRRESRAAVRRVRVDQGCSANPRSLSAAAA